MRFKVDNYIVNVNAKVSYETRMNKKAVLSFCNTMAIVCREARESYKSRNVKALAEMAEKMANEFHNIVEQNGGYED